MDFRLKPQPCREILLKAFLTSQSGRIAAQAELLGISVAGEGVQNPFHCSELTENDLITLLAPRSASTLEI